MSKQFFFIAILSLLSNSASSIEILNDISVTYGTSSIGYDQDGDEFRLSHNDFSVYHADEVRVGIEYELALPANNWRSTVALEHSDLEEITVVISLSYQVAQISVAPEVTRNIDTSEFTSEVEADYTWNISDALTVTPNISIPFDHNWDRGEMVAGISVSIEFDSDFGSN